jgi:hypothetical protein
MMGGESRVIRTASVEIENPPRGLEALVRAYALHDEAFASCEVWMLRYRDADTAAAFHVQRSTTGAFMHSPLAMKLKASGTPMHNQ